jgi:hypothetical protein
LWRATEGNRLREPSPHGERSQPTHQSRLQPIPPDDYQIGYEGMNLAEAHDLLGTLVERKGQVDAVLREYSEAVRLRPDLSHAQLDLGECLPTKETRLPRRSIFGSLQEAAIRIFAISPNAFLRSWNRVSRRRVVFPAAV